MNCSEIRPLIDAYLDRELDLMTSLRVEEHLSTCADCLHILERRTAVQTAVRAESLRFSVPGGLEKRITISLQQSARTGTLSTAIPARFPLRSWQSFSLAACVLLLACILWQVGTKPSSLTPDALLTEELVSGHVRSLMATHIFDVASTNQHTVKPWFAGKLDYSPPVLNFADKGFPLVGGRLDYMNGRPVAAMVYKRHQHWINFFAWPVTAPDKPAQHRFERGYTVFHWTESGMTYAAVSDLNEAELEEFVRLEQSATREIPITAH